MHRRVLDFPVKVVLGTLTTATDGMFGAFKLVGHLFGRRSSEDLINAAEDENKYLHEKIQV